MTFGAIALTNTKTCFNGCRDIFIAKYNANGEVLWAKSAGGTNSDLPYSVTADASGNIWVAGVTGSPNAVFDSIALPKTTNMLMSGAFLAKYDNNGNVLWAKRTDGATSLSVAVDASGDAYLAGNFTKASVLFGSITLMNSKKIQTSDIFLAKYGPNGEILWAKSTGGRLNDEAYTVAVDSKGDAYIAGSYVSFTLNFDSIVLSNTTATSTSDIFLAKYNGDGKVLWAKSAGGRLFDDASSISFDPSGDIYISGSFSSRTLQFDSLALNNTGGPLNNNNNFYIAKLGYKSREPGK
jgi:hypothetical protein